MKRDILLAYMGLVIYQNGDETYGYQEVKINQKEGENVKLLELVGKPHYFSKQLNTKSKSVGSIFKMTISDQNVSYVKKITASYHISNYENVKEVYHSWFQVDKTNTIAKNVDKELLKSAKQGELELEKKLSFATRHYSTLRTKLQRSAYLAEIIEIVTSSRLL